MGDIFSFYIIIIVIIIIIPRTSFFQTYGILLFFFFYLFIFLFQQLLPQAFACHLYARTMLEFLFFNLLTFFFFFLQQVYFLLRNCISRPSFGILRSQKALDEFGKDIKTGPHTNVPYH